MDSQPLVTQNELQDKSASYIIGYTQGIVRYLAEYMERAENVDREWVASNLIRAYEALEVGFRTYQAEICNINVKPTPTAQDDIVELERATK